MIVAIVDSDCCCRSLTLLFVFFVVCLSMVPVGAIVRSCYLFAVAYLLLSLVSYCCCWCSACLLMVAVGCSWLLLVVHGCCWLFTVAAGC